MKVDKEILLLKRECLLSAASGSGEHQYDMLCQAAVQHFNGGRKHEAINALKQAIAMDPKSFTAYFQIGQVYEVCGDDIPGSQELAAISYLKSMDLAAPESETPDFAACELHCTPHGLEEPSVLN